MVFAFANSSEKTQFWAAILTWSPEILHEEFAHRPVA
jgi:hypothetical protein